MRKKWTKEEDDILKKYYPTAATLDEIPLPGRTKNAIGGRAYHLKLKPKPGRNRRGRVGPKMSDEEKKKKANELGLKYRADPRFVLFNNAKSRAKQNNLTFDIKIDDIVVPEYCPVYGMKLKVGKGKAHDASPSLDRKNPLIGYTKENIWVISHKANRIKNNASISDLELLVNAAKDNIAASHKKYESGQGFKILVVGENCRDGWILGPVRVNPEAPTMVISPTEEKYNAGMAGNLFENLKSLSPESFVFFISQSNLISKTRYVDCASGYTLLRIDINDKAHKELDIETFEEELKKQKISIEIFDAVVVSDYNKSFLTKEFMQGLFEICIDLGIPTWLDTKKQLGEWSKDVFCVKINKKEYDSQLNSGLQHCQNLLVTLGREGIWWVNQDKKYHAEQVQISCLSGAGDTALAGLVIGYLENNGDMVKAIEFANRAARVAVSHAGVVAVKREEI